MNVGLSILIFLCIDFFLRFLYEYFIFLISIHVIIMTNSKYAGVCLFLAGMITGSVRCTGRAVRVVQVSWICSS